MVMFNQRQRSMPQPQTAVPQAHSGLEGLALVRSEAEVYLALPEVIQHAPQSAQGGQSWRWLMIALLSCCATSVAALGAFIWLINLPPSADCEDAASITTDRAQLYCAQMAA
ncbi:MAG TPA: hypothetical protein IGR64_07305, partial [Leptolyngbyaceae cyanobacterium M65_K2018_010]|nr:hypothetical protein [Leptolyngbyaceae cyanobacterium M65_K2018_010]